MQHSECFHTFLYLAFKVLLTDIRDVLHISRDTRFCSSMNIEKCRTSYIAADHLLHLCTRRTGYKLEGYSPSTQCIQLSILHSTKANELVKNHVRWKGYTSVHFLTAPRSWRAFLLLFWLLNICLIFNHSLILYTYAWHNKTVTHATNCKAKQDRKQKTNVGIKLLKVSVWIRTYPDARGEEILFVWAVESHQEFIWGVILLSA